MPFQGIAEDCRDGVVVLGRDDESAVRLVNGRIFLLAAFEFLYTYWDRRKA